MRFLTMYISVDQKQCLLLLFLVSRFVNLLKKFQWNLRQLFSLGSAILANLKAKLIFTSAACISGGGCFPVSLASFSVPIWRSPDNLTTVSQSRHGGILDTGVSCEQRHQTDKQETKKHNGECPRFFVSFQIQKLCASWEEPVVCVTYYEASLRFSQE